MNRATLDQLITQARKARDDAGRALADERVGHQQLENHLELLRTYRLEYSLNLQSALLQGMPLATLQDYQSFLASLDRALQQGEHSLAEKVARLSDAQGQWRDKQKRLDTFDALHRRHEAEVQRVEGRREQRGIDELSSQFAARERLRQTQQAQELL